MNYVNMKITRECTTLDEDGVPVSTPDLTFTWRLGDTDFNGFGYGNSVASEENSVIPVEISTGRYQVVFVVDEPAGGIVHYRWDTEGDIDVAKEGRLYVKPSVFAA